MKNIDQSPINFLKKLIRLLWKSKKSITKIVQIFLPLHYLSRKAAIDTNVVLHKVCAIRHSNGGITYFYSRTKIFKKHGKKSSKNYNYPLKYCHNTVTSTVTCFKWLWNRFLSKHSPTTTKSLLEARKKILFSRLKM